MSLFGLKRREILHPTSELRVVAGYVPFRKIQRWWEGYENLEGVGKVWTGEWRDVPLDEELQVREKR